MKTSLFCALIVCEFTSSFSSAETLTPISRNEPLGTYSDMRYGKAEGYDGFMAGVEITVTKGTRCGGGSCKMEHFVILQCAQGTPGMPAVFPATVKNYNISFNIEANGQSECTTENTVFTGQFKPDGLVGRFGDAAPLTLKKKELFWDKVRK